MNVFIDVANNQVTIDGRTVGFDVSTLASLYEAINHSDVGTHVRTSAGKVVTEGVVIPGIDAIIEAAQEVIAANEEQQQLINATPKFEITRYTYDDFNVYRVFAAEPGSITFSGDGIDIDRTQSRRVSMVTKGSRQYEPLNGRFAPVTLGVGDYNLDLPDMLASDRYKVTSMQPDTEYHCISRVDLQPYNYERVAAVAGQQVILPAGRSLFVGGGRVIGIDAPTVIYKTHEARTLDVEADTFGLIFW